MTEARPVTARAKLRHMSVASEPELQKRTSSTAGKRAHMSSANRASYRLGPPSTRPPANASWMARTIFGSECP